MNSKILAIIVGLFVATASLLVACGGGSSGSSATGTTPSAATGTTSGVLSAFGSVIVNGHEYATGSSTAVVDGDADDAATSLAALSVGMTVDVDSDGQAASRVRFASVVRGEVDAVDVAASTLTVLGQTVMVSSATLFAGSSAAGGTSSAVTGLSSVSAGDYVVVYGAFQCKVAAASCASGGTTVLASLVDKPAVPGAYRVEGYAQNATATGFMINGLAVDLVASGSGATACTPSPCAIASGELVAVRSTAGPVVAANVLTLTAQSARIARAAPVLVAGTAVSIEGPVAQINATAGTFSVRGIVVDGSALAATMGALTAGQVVTVTGTATASGTITATAIVVEQHATFAITAPLSAQSASAGTLTVLGQAFAVNSATRFVDRIGDTRPFNSGNFTTVLALQDTLIVSGYGGAAGNVATRVERIAAPPTPTVAVLGIASADSASAGTVTIGGITVTLGGSTTLDYSGAGSAPTLAGFFTAITVQSSVVGIVGTAGAAPATIDATRAIVMSSNCRWASGPF